MDNWVKTLPVKWVALTLPGGGELFLDPTAMRVAYMMRAQGDTETRLWLSFSNTIEQISCTETPAEVAKCLNDSFNS